MPNAIIPEARFMSYVRKKANAQGCWIWIGATNNNGYGVFKLHGRSRSAQRASYMLFREPTIAAGLQVCHHCDNPPCVNPRHLFLGTATENAQDAAMKGRRVREGCKLNESDRLLIFKMRSAGTGVRAISRHFAVSHTAIQKALKRRAGATTVANSHGA